MIAVLTLVIHASLLVAFIAGGFLAWHGLTPDPRVDSLRHGTAARTQQGGEALTGARCVDSVYDQDTVTA